MGTPGFGLFLGSAFSWVRPFPGFGRLGSACRDSAAGVRPPGFGRRGWAFSVKITENSVKITENTQKSLKSHKTLKKIQKFWGKIAKFLG